MEEVWVGEMIGVIGAIRGDRRSRGDKRTGGG